MPVEYEMSNILDKFDDESIDVEEEIAESEEDILSQKQRSRKLYIDKGEKSVSDLFRMIKEKDINLVVLNTSKCFYWQYIGSLIFYTFFSIKD